MKLIFKNSKNSKRASFISQEENEKEIKESKEENSSEEEDSSSNEKSSLNIKIIKYRKERKNLIQNAKKKIGKLNFVSISHKKIERAKKMSLFLKMQEDKRETNINQIISSYMQKCENNDEMVKEDLNSQISFIKARIEQKSYGIFVYFLIFYVFRKINRTHFNKNPRKKNIPCKILFIRRNSTSHS